MSVAQATLTPPVTADDHLLGPDNAAVTLVEYGDYECSHCGRAHAIVHEVLRHREGQVRFGFRHFPLARSHPHAKQAAAAAEAAAAQSQFWAMHERLFTHQDRLDEASLIAHAAAIGLAADQFAQDLGHETTAERVQADFLSGVRSGVNGTPTFFINDRRHDAAWDVASLLAAIDAAS
ncbi:MAG: DsbA family protein [Chloroflexia bacterium]|nr:DsbA family protein [Chloroflexia bacterium]MDQ3411198.1 DsbA family protein [Chloroflexota bacterium]